LQYQNTNFWSFQQFSEVKQWLPNLLGHGIMLESEKKRKLKRNELTENSVRNCKVAPVKSTLLVIVFQAFREKRLCYRFVTQFVTV